MAGEYSTSDFKKGLKVVLDGEPYLITEYEFMKPGKGQAVYRLKLKNLIRGNTLDRNYRSGDKIPAADVEERSLQYMYNDSKNWFFMDQESYEQYSISKENLAESWQWLKEETVCAVTFWDGHPITVEVPNHMELVIEYTEPGARGNTATNVRKSAKLETGAEVLVPIFVNSGDKIRIDTRTGEYIERVQSK